MSTSASTWALKSCRRWTGRPCVLVAASSGWAGCEVVHAMASRTVVPQRRCALDRQRRTDALGALLHGPQSQMSRAILACVEAGSVIRDEHLDARGRGEVNSDRCGLCMFDAVVERFKRDPVQMLSTSVRSRASVRRRKSSAGRIGPLVRPCASNWTRVPTPVGSNVILLESPNPRTVALYERQGFVVTAESQSGSARR